MVGCCRRLGLRGWERTLALFALSHSSSISFRSTHLLSSLSFAPQISSQPAPPSTSTMSRASSSCTSTIQQVLSDLGDQVFLLDGGTGEELFRRGVPDDRQIWSATAVVHEQCHSVLEQVHLSFLQAGANAITTNSYGIVPGVGFTNTDERGRYLAQAGKIARAAVEKYQTKNTTNDVQPIPRLLFVLGSLGPLVESYRPDLIRDHAVGVQEYTVAVQALQPYVDAFLAETMSCLDEALQALEAVSSQSQQEPPRSLLVSFTLQSDGRLRDSQSVASAIPILLQKARDYKVPLLAILFNCSEPEAISRALETIASRPELVQSLDRANIRLGAYANRLTPVDPNWTLAESEVAQPFRPDLDPPDYWKRFVQPWIQTYGVRMVGGCCGIAPEHIQYIAEQLESTAKTNP
eukprot:Nitzschia sp. Nitz4//scaffold8_size234185//150466//151828//NITZ4_001274-RA/size234185-augustus-gene-0.246-mRNA-1//1//CDS//3329559857//1770//frame0